MKKTLLMVITLILCLITSFAMAGDEMTHDEAIKPFVGMNNVVTIEEIPGLGEVAVITFFNKDMEFQGAEIVTKNVVPILILNKYREIIWKNPSMSFNGFTEDLFKNWKPKTIKKQKKPLKKWDV